MVAPADASATLLHLHGQVLRLIASVTGIHCDGLGHAARSLRRVGGMTNATAKQFVALDTSAARARHVTAPRCSLPLDMAS
eukprot:10118462-Alexandrium_andersonii.AAC.1